MIDGATPIDWMLWIGLCCSLLGAGALALWVGRLPPATP